MRLPNNYGSVIKLGGKRRKPFAARKKIGENINGSPQYKYLGYFETRKEALIFLGKYNEGKITDKNVEISSITFKDVFDEWITEHERYKSVSQKTHESYVCAYNQLKELHGRIFASLTINDLQKQVDKYEGMSKSTISKPIILLHFMYKYAMKQNYVDKDISQFLIMVSHSDKVSLHKAIKKEDILQIRKDADAGNEDAMRIMIYIYTGFRATELLEMRTENVYLKEKYFLGGKKTDAGKSRAVPIHRDIMKYVKHFYNKDNEFFFEENGKPIKYLHFKDYHVIPYFESHNMKHTMHDTRHTCATLLKEYGCDDLYRKLILGHKIADLTDRVYTHVEIQRLILEMNKIAL